MTAPLFNAVCGNVFCLPVYAYKIIGNAVPCVLAYNIAMRLSENWHKYFGGDVL